MNEKRNGFNDIVVNFLKKEEQKIQEKCEDLLKQGKLNEYKNLIRAYSDIVAQIRLYDWQLIYSEYETKSPIEGEFHKQVAVWEQNGDGQIRNHKVWNIDEKFDIDKFMKENRK